MCIYSYTYACIRTHTHIYIYIQHMYKCINISSPSTRNKGTDLFARKTGHDLGMLVEGGIFDEGLPRPQLLCRRNPTSH